jgi:hypothetical protein
MRIERTPDNTPKSIGIVSMGNATSQEHSSIEYAMYNTENSIDLSSCITAVFQC